MTDNYVIDKLPGGGQIEYLDNPVTHVKNIFTHDEWIRKDQAAHYAIYKLSKTDELAQFFMRQFEYAQVIFADDPRLMVSYGYYVGTGTITAEQAENILGKPVTPLTKEQAEGLL